MSKPAETHAPAAATAPPPRPMAFGYVGICQYLPMSHWTLRKYIKVNRNKSTPIMDMMHFEGEGERIFAFIDELIAYRDGCPRLSDLAKTPVMNQALSDHHANKRRAAAKPAARKRGRAS